MSSPRTPPVEPGRLLTPLERKRALDAVLFWTLVAFSTAMAVPWFLRAIPLTLGPIAWSVLAYALLHVALARASDRLPGERALRIATAGLQALGLAVLAVLWHMAGGLHNQVLLCAFFPPVIATGAALGRPLGAVAALASAAVVGVVSVSESPELRWYLSQLGLPVYRLPRPLLDLAAGVTPPGARGEPAYDFLTVSSFAILLVASAWIAGGFVEGLAALRQRRQMQAAGRGEATALSQAALRAAPLPTVVVFADSGQVALVSDSFQQGMLLHGEDLVGRDLFELLRFAEPRQVRERMGAGNDELPFCAYSVGQEPRVARLLFSSFQHEGVRFAAIRFEDRSELFYLSAALDAQEEAWLLLGSDGRLRYANRAAGERFGELYFGRELGAALERSEHAASVRERVSLRLAGEAGELTLVRLQREGPGGQGLREPQA